MSLERRDTSETKKGQSIESTEEEYAAESKVGSPNPYSSSENALLYVTSQYGRVVEHAIECAVEPTIDRASIPYSW